MKNAHLVLLGLLMISGCQTTAPAPSRSAAPGWSIPEGVKTVQVNGYPMAYQDTGNGVPLVLVHGSLNDYRVWYAQLPEFTKQYRVINVSLRHYYPERWNGQGSGFLITDHAADVAAFIQALNLGKVHLLGHSRGGAVVLNVAKSHPELIRSLILEDASGMESLLPDTPETAKAAGELKVMVAKLRTTYAAGESERAAQEWVDALSGPGAWAKRTKEQQQIVLDNLGTAAGDTGERPVTSCAEIAKFDFPVLLLTGERSPKRYGQMFSAMRACNASIPAPIVIPSAAHSMNRENPGPFNAAVLEFMARN